MAATSQVSLNYPKVRDVLEKFIKIVRTDTTAFLAAWLPKDAIIVGIHDDSPCGIGRGAGGGTIS